MIPRGLVKTVTGMFIELSRDVYTRDFEQPFLLATSNFYQAESNEYISQNSASDYMKKARILAVPHAPPSRPCGEPSR